MFVLMSVKMANKISIYLISAGICGLSLSITVPTRDSQCRKRSAYTPASLVIHLSVLTDENTQPIKRIISARRVFVVYSDRITRSDAYDGFFPCW